MQNVNFMIAGKSSFETAFGVKWSDCKTGLQNVIVWLNLNLKQSTMDGKNLKLMKNLKRTLF